MRLPSALLEARFVRRLNRFAAIVTVGGTERMVHVANSGRMRELLQAGNRVLLAPVSSMGLKTTHYLALVDLGHTLVSADARLPPYLVHEALAEGRLPQFAGYTSFRREVMFGESRLDLLLQGPQGQCYMEVKSVTLVEGGTGLFPDAPTIRGAKHVRSLAQALGEGHRAAVVFVVQREDAAAFAPNDAADPAFGEALRLAHAQGVEVYAYRCRVSRGAVVLADQLPVCLRAPASVGPREKPGNQAPQGISR